MAEPALEEPPVLLEDHYALAQLVVVDLTECVNPSLDLPIVEDMFRTNNVGTIGEIGLAEPAVSWPRPVLEVLQLLIADLHGLWDQLCRLLQE